MGFFDSLAANPGGSGVYGGVNPSNYSTGDALLYKKQRDQMDMENEQKMANFNSNLQLKQERLRRLYADPNMGYGTPGNPSGQPNVVFKDNHPDITPLQTATLDVQKERFADERKDKDFAQNQAQQRTNLAGQNLELEKKKNQQIYDTKQADLQRKADEAAARESLARDQMKGKENDFQALQRHRDAALESTNAKHALDLSTKDRQHQEDLAELKRKHDAEIEALKARGSSVTETEVTPEGNKKKVTKKSGSDNSGKDNDPLGIR
jgi:hypothetical protein